MLDFRNDNWGYEMNKLGICDLFHYLSAIKPIKATISRFINNPKTHIMKKIFTVSMFLLLIAFIGQEAFSQHVYFRFGFGYNHPSSTQTLMYEYEDYEGGGNEKVIHMSFGKGLNFDYAFGGMFSKYVGVELGLSYLMGLKTKSESSYFSQYYGSGTYSTEVSAQMFRIIPAVVITPGLENINPYARVGMVIGLGSIFINEEDYYDGEMMTRETKLNGGVALGLNTAAGVQFNINNIISFYVELNIVSMSYAPSKGEITLYELNGMDRLYTLTTRERETEFVDELTYNYNYDPPENQPDENLEMKFPFSSFGSSFGVIISIGK